MDGEDWDEKEIRRRRLVKSRMDEEEWGGSVKMERMRNRLGRED